MADSTDYVAPFAPTTAEKYPWPPRRHKWRKLLASNGQRGLQCEGCEKYVRGTESPDDAEACRGRWGSTPRPGGAS